MTVKRGNRRKSRPPKFCKRSLLKCPKCRFVARNHIKLKMHSALYHRHVEFGKASGRNPRSVESRKSCQNSSLRGQTKRSPGRRKTEVPKRIGDPRKSGDLASKREPCQTTFVTVKNEVIVEYAVMTRTRSRSLKAEDELARSKTAVRGTRGTGERKRELDKSTGRKANLITKKKKKREKRVFQPLQCGLCDYVGRDAFNLKRHTVSKHQPKPPKVPKIYECEECDYKNKYRFLVRRHSTTHSRESCQRGEKPSGFACDRCSYVSASACNLKRHQVNRHEKVKEAKLQCSLCDHREPDRPALFVHFRVAHGVIIETERLEFDNFQAFLDFKTDTEKATFARFVRQQTRTGKKKHVIFKCHRDGIFKSKSGGERKRALKTTGSNKINSACPACMRMTIDPNGKVSVIFTKTHVGHSNEVCRLTLTKEEKLLIGEMLESKRTFQEILCEIRNGMDSDRLERIHLLSRKDLQNIERWYKTRDIEEPPRESIDMNIEDWVAKISKDTQAVRLYKKPATILPKPFKCLEYDDLVLILANDLQLAMLKQYGSECICIDNSYESSQVKLTALLVLDDNHQGFPCAFMLSSKIDRIIMKVFVDVIRKESDCPMTPSVFITDIPDYRRTEWNAVMDLPKTTEVIYSPWSVEDDLRRNLSKVKAEFAREGVYNAVKKVICEENAASIPHLVEKTLTSFNEHPRTELFGKYFKSKFAETAGKWALALRNLPVDSSENLESVHAILKFVYSEGLKNAKLEECIGVLMTCGRDQLQERIVLYEQISPETADADEVKKLVESIIKRHADAHDMKSKPADPGVYEIMENNLHCRCGLRCYKCDVCIHSYRCTCNDSMIGWTICRHIHFCVMSNVTEQESNPAVHQFDPAEEKRKLLLEFENMCDDIAANEDSIDEATVPVVEELPQADILVKRELPQSEPEYPLQQQLLDQKQLQQQLSSLPQPQEPLEDAKTKLQWRFQSICQQISSNVDLSLIEQALASMENAISLRQNQKPK